MIHSIAYNLKKSRVHQRLPYPNHTGKNWNVSASGLHVMRFGSLDQAKFDRIFPIFLASTDEKQQMAKGYQQWFQGLQNSGWLRPRRNIRILDLGAGNGYTSAIIFKALRAYFPGKALNVMAMDNNTGQLRDYAQCIQAIANSHVRTQETDVFNRNFKPGGADFILASHMFYHTSPQALPMVLDSLDKALAPKGFMSIVMLDPKSDFDVIQQQFGTFVTEDDKQNPVAVTLPDIKQAISESPVLKQRAISLPYDAYVYFPSIPGGFRRFMDWQLKSPDALAPNPACQTTLDLLEFVLHGDLAALRQKGKLGDFLNTIDTMFIRNGLDSQGCSRLNFQGENIFILGADLESSFKNVQTS